MGSVTLQQILDLVSHLSEEEQAKLVQHLQKRLTMKSDRPITRKALITEREQLQAESAFDDAENLWGKYAQPGLELTDDELNKSLREISSQWDRALDELTD